MVTSRLCLLVLLCGRIVLSISFLLDTEERGNCRARAGTAQCLHFLNFEFHFGTVGNQDVQPLDGPTG